jgi:hypothetical protein
MRRSVVGFCVLIGAVAPLNPSIGRANDLDDAISRTRSAIEQGRKGSADALVVHAKAALKSARHAYAARVGSFSSQEADAKAQANEPLKASLSNLKAAVSEGKKRRADAATHQAEEALSRLEATPH